MSFHYSIYFHRGFEKYLSREPMILSHSYLTTYTKTIKDIFFGNIPGQLIIQYTDVCNPYPCGGGVNYFYFNAASKKIHACGYRNGETNLAFNQHKKWNFNKQISCRKCDWECFRDPSEFFGFPLHLIKNPRIFLKRLINDREYCSLWLNDLKYYLACDFFDARKPQNSKELLKFSNSRLLNFYNYLKINVN